MRPFMPHYVDTPNFYQNRQQQQPVIIINVNMAACAPQQNYQQQPMMMMMPIPLEPLQNYQQRPMMMMPITPEPMQNYQQRLMPIPPEPMQTYEQRPVMMMPIPPELMQTYEQRPVMMMPIPPEPMQTYEQRPVMIPLEPMQNYEQRLVMPMSIPPEPMQNYGPMSIPLEPMQNYEQRPVMMMSIPPEPMQNYEQLPVVMMPIPPEPIAPYHTGTNTACSCQGCQNHQLPPAQEWAPSRMDSNVFTGSNPTQNQRQQQQSVPPPPGVISSIIDDQNSGITRATELLNNTPKVTTDEIDAIISTMVGLDELKLQMKKWIKKLVLDQKRKNLGLEVGPWKPLHMAFLGNPGTGKTMVARYLGKILHKLGLISTDKVTEVQRTDLVSECIGKTGPKTRIKIKEAYGGILFVDEAYKLMPPDFPMDHGIEALEEIMAATDSEDIVTIFAGYNEDMKRVITANAGFSRRVSNFFYFDDYSPREIAMILLTKIKTQKKGSFIFGFKLHPDCTVKAVAQLIKEHMTEEQLKEMNGGLVDPLLVKALENMDLRLDEECGDADALTMITMEDLQEGLKSLSKSKKQESSPGKNIAPPSMYI